MWHVSIMVEEQQVAMQLISSSLITSTGCLKKLGFTELWICTLEPSCFGQPVSENCYFFWSFLTKIKWDQTTVSHVYGKIWPQSTQFWLGYFGTVQSLSGDNFQLKNHDLMLWNNRSVDKKNLPKKFNHSTHFRYIFMHFQTAMFTVHPQMMI